MLAQLQLAEKLVVLFAAALVEYAELAAEQLAVLQLEEVEVLPGRLEQAAVCHFVRSASKKDQMTAA